jgi:hypothetical protein
LTRRRTQAPESRKLLSRKRWWVVLLPLLGLGALVLLAPPLPPSPKKSPLELTSATRDEPLIFRSDDEAFALNLDPRRVRFDLFEGWDREDEAFADRGALAFVSGPMYEQIIEAGQEHSVPLGDLKLGERVWRSHNRSAARERAYMGIRHDGRVDFGYGELTPEREGLYDTFIGGLHAVYNELESPPPQYKGAYSIGMGQRIRYFLPRIRLVYGLRRDGRIEILMSRDGLTLEQTRALAEQRQLLAAYLPDHASKSRLIVPGEKGFSQEDANWISGGATSFVHVPYMLRLSPRRQPLAGSMLARITPQLPHPSCGDPISCGNKLANLVLDRALAGFNRVMEKGVEPLARLIWAPKVQRQAGRSHQQPPLREPVITADPRTMQMRQERELVAPTQPPSPSADPSASPAQEPSPAAPTTTTPTGETPATPQAEMPAPDQSRPGQMPQTREAKPQAGGVPAPSPSAGNGDLPRSSPPAAPVNAPPPVNQPQAAIPRIGPPPPVLPPPPLP